MTVLTTGGVAPLLNLAEPQLQDRLRRGRVSAPTGGSGRIRLWTREDILRAARDLGLDVAEVSRRLDEEGAERREGVGT